MIGKMTKQLYLIRHAESQANTTPNIVSGRSNESPLTTRGVDQAMRLGGYLRAHNIIPTTVYVSPAERTIQTAKYALRAMGLTVPLVINNDLQELDMGSFTGRIRGEVYTPDTFEAIRRDGKDFAPPGGESMNQVGRTRMLGWVKANFSEAGAEVNEVPTIAVTHGLAIRCFAAVLEDWPAEQTYAEVVGNASINSFSGLGHTWHLDYLNRSTQQA